MVTDPNSGLKTCVSLNTAAALLINKTRITYQPLAKGKAEQAGMQVRIDGRIRNIPRGGLNLAGGGHVDALSGGGIVVQNSDSATVSIIPNFWSSQSLWYLSISVTNTRADEGIMGAMANGSWLPRLANGSNIGALPAAMNQRYSDLYGVFANSWRVTAATTLFDYAPGKGTTSFTNMSWPSQTEPCVVKGMVNKVEPLNQALAAKVCAKIEDKTAHQNCITDAQTMGDAAVAKIYLKQQMFDAWLRQNRFGNR
jgi:lysyl endopeptidase